MENIEKCEYINKQQILENDNLYSCSEHKPIMRDTDFCSYGERKEK